MNDDINKNDINNTVYFSALVVIQHDRDESNKFGLIIAYDCVYDTISDKYYFTNMAVRKDAISHDKLIFLSRKDLYDYIKSIVVFNE